MVEKQSEAFHTCFCGILLSIKMNFIAYRSFKVSSRPDCIFEIHQLWQSGFSWMYSNCCCSCSFEPEIITTGQSSHKMYSNNILNFQASTTILNSCTKKSGNLLKAPRICLFLFGWIFYHHLSGFCILSLSASFSVPLEYQTDFTCIYAGVNIFHFLIFSYYW